MSGEPTADIQHPVAREARVTGRVQGVTYRASCAEQAERLGVAGWVRNEPDGSVCLHAEGAVDAVDALLDWCRTGPPAARVEKVDVSEAEPTGATGFRDA